MSKIIVTVGIDGDRIIAHAYYGIIVSCVFSFKSHEYSKHLFSFIGEKLGEGLFFKSKRADVFLPDKTQFYNGYNFIGPCDEPGWNRSMLTKIGREKQIGCDEMEALCLAFRKGLRTRFSSVCCGESLYNFAHR